MGGRPGVRLRWAPAIGMTAAALLSACQSAPAPAPTPCPLRVDGVVWQVSNAAIRPHGQWQRLGVHRLLVQWLEVDGIGFVPAAPGGAGAARAPVLPDWSRIATEPWAQSVVLGLAGMHQEAAARTQLTGLSERSRQLAATALPLRTEAWYFPTEVDPTWADPQQLAPALALLPRPLWISAYDSANVGPQALADWIERWVPADVGVLFQDGVGVHARTPMVAREYLEVLSRRLGHKRVQVIAEAFRPSAGGGMRGATADELVPQLRAYQDWPLWLFDGPHYVNDALVDALVTQGVGAAAGPAGCRRAP